MTEETGGVWHYASSEELHLISLQVALIKSQTQCGIVQSPLKEGLLWKMIWENPGLLGFSSVFDQIFLYIPQRIVILSILRHTLVLYQNYILIFI